MGLPPVDLPETLHSSREYMCMLPDESMCQYQQGYWRFWYHADLVYGLGAIYLFVAIVGVFALRHAFSHTAVLRSKVLSRPRAFGRWLAYKGLRLDRLDWNSPSYGVLALGLVGLAFFFAMVLGPKPYYWPTTADVHWGDSPPLATRSGWLSLGCLPFVIATSSKVNMITAITGISHERLQVFHRWSAYAMFVLALLHTFPFIIFARDWGTLGEQWNTNLFYWTGVAALIPQAWLTFASAKPLRSLSYELFKFLHFLGAALFVAFFFAHCDFTLTSADYFFATAAIYVPCFLYSIVRTYVQYGLLRATLTTTENGFVRIAIPMKAHWQPGQHYFLRFASFGVHAICAHPFTACSLPSPDTNTAELVFYVRAQKGFTRRLYNYVDNNQGTAVKVLLDGPYGGMDPSKLAQPGRHLIIAGGSGSGWILPVLERILQFDVAAARQRQRQRLAGEEQSKEADSLLSSTESTASRSVRVVLATREPAARRWFRDRLDELLERYADVPSLAAVVTVDVHYTGAATHSLPSTSDSSSDDLEKSSGKVLHETADDSSDLSSTRAKRGRSEVARATAGRPDLPAIIREEAAAAGSQGEEAAEEGANGLRVYACGPLSMQQDVRQACAGEQFGAGGGGKGGGVYMHLEHFDWA